MEHAWRGLHHHRVHLGGVLKARAVLARSVFHVGRRIVVARRAVGAAQHLRVVADAVAVRIGCAAAATHAQGVQLVAVTITSTGRNVRAAALVNLARSVAHATSVKRPHAIVLVVTHPVAVGVVGAIATTNAHRIQNVAVAVALSVFNRRTTALQHRARAVAHAASIVRTHAVVLVVAHPVAVRICRTVATAHAQGVKLVAVAIAVA